VARESGDDGHSGHRRSGFAAAQTVAVTLLTGIVVGVLAGYGLDRLLHSAPWFSMIGLFVGFGVALAAVFFETK
jgi:F0F1-type ATP synthase assembly protein I